MNIELQRKVFKWFEDEIWIPSFESNSTTMLKTLLIYKYKMAIDSFRFNDRPLQFIFIDHEVIDDGIINAIVIGGSPNPEVFVKDDLITGFVNAKIKTLDEVPFEIYLNEERKVVHIVKENKPDSEFVNIWNTSTERVFCSILKKLMPWYFGTMSADLYYIAEWFIRPDQFQNIEQEFETVIGDMGILEQIQLRDLEKMGEKIIENKTKNLRLDIERLTQEYEDYYARLGEINTKIKNKKCNIAAIELSMEELENPIHEIIEFVKSPAIDMKLDGVDGDSIKFQIRTTLKMFDDTDYQTHVEKNEGTSYLYTCLDYDKNEYDVACVRKMYEHLMKTKDYKVWVGGYIETNLVNGTAHANRRIDMPHTGNHPHLNGGLSCFGDAEGVIKDLLRDNRFYEALNQIMFSCQQFTIHDTYAGEYFVSSISQTDCIECPDGSFVNANGMLKLMKEEIDG